MPPLNLHGTAIALGTRAVLLRGPPGSGKSDLALRCLALPPGPLIPEPVRLVADDRVIVEAIADKLQGRAPATLAGLLEIRGVGIVRVPSIDVADIRLVLELTPPADVQRLPELQWTEIAGIRLPYAHLWPFEPSAAIKAMAMLQERARR